MTIIKFNGGQTSFENEPTCFNCGTVSSIEEIKFYEGNCQSCYPDQTMDDQEDELV